MGDDDHPMSIARGPEVGKPGMMRIGGYSPPGDRVPRPCIVSCGVVPAPAALALSQTGRLES
ncbi:hypothetical protein DZF99_02085 [Clavibacter phaseoli]|nr:hypothetical protein DZF99_02085 [Clavibacter phaseoli]